MSCGVKEEVFLGTLIGIGCWGLGSVNLKEANPSTIISLNAAADFAERDPRTTKTEVVCSHTSNAHACSNETTNTTEYGRSHFVTKSLVNCLSMFLAQIPVSYLPKL